MDSNQFDLLTRQLATGTSRRQVLKGIVSLAVGTLLSNLGLKPTTPVYAESGVNQGDTAPLFMPYVSRICDVATVCDHPVKCGVDCRCIQTPEGEIKCGSTPPCSAQECTTSADCANLGEGYFCDTPNSGCCDRDSDVKKQRCIPPCGAVAACPDERICGDRCCAQGQLCSAGACVSGYDCEFSAITKKSREAALAALANGTTSVDLTPQGCIKIKQTVVDNQITSRYFIIADRTISSWSVTGDQLVVWRDSDGDGIHEWSSVTTLGATDDEFQSVETELLPSPQPSRRTTITPQGEMTRFVVEEQDGAGQWQQVADYQTPRIQDAVLGPELLSSDEIDETPYADEPCEADPCSPEAIKSRMDEGVEYALQCLVDLGQTGQDIYEASLNILQRQMNFTCAPIPGKPQANIGGWDRPRGPLNVTIDPVKYCPLKGEQRAWLLFHEILHASLRRGHTPGSDDLVEEQVKQIDRVYGCMAMCYNNRFQRTRCMCAQCLNTVPCDPICKAYNPDCGATCPCISMNNKYYDKCSGCLSGCPSGLGCAFTSYCEPVGQSSLCPPVTCP